MHDRLTVQWHEEAFETWRAPLDDRESLVARQHLANFELWHTEDLARTPGATDAELARIKHRIDETNQRRNDLSEQFDLSLLSFLSSQALPNPSAELNSESPGLIVDRLSILALKIFHTRQETLRPDASQAHIIRNQARLDILIEQRTDLANV